MEKAWKAQSNRTSKTEMLTNRFVGLRQHLMGFQKHTREERNKRRSEALTQIKQLNDKNATGHKNARGGDMRTEEIQGGGSRRRPQARDGLETTIETTTVVRSGCQHKIFPFSNIRGLTNY